MINDFAGVGISIATTDNTVASSYIGTNAAGTAADRADGWRYFDHGGQQYDRRHGHRRGQRHLGQHRRRRRDHRHRHDGQRGRGQLDRHRRHRHHADGQRPDGVEIDSGASGNTIGGTTAAARNIISANAYSGVEIDDANDNLVEGDFIGTDVTGTVALGNNSVDVEFAGGVLLYLAPPATPSAGSPRHRAPAQAT